VRAQARVELTVSPQTAAVFEGLATLLTHVGPLARVLAQVVLVVGAPLEGELAVGALERSHTCMHLERRGGGDQSENN
jgi:hypothetical protein